MQRLSLLSIILCTSVFLNAQVTVTVNTALKKQTIRGMGCQADLESPGGTNDELLYDLGASSFRVFAGESSDNYHWDEPVNDDGSPTTTDLSKFIFLPNNDAATRTKRLNELKKAAQRLSLIHI